MTRSPLRHPVVIGGVVVGLLAVATLNFMTFAPDRRGRSHRGGGADGYLTPPDDLASMVDDARRGPRGPAGTGAVRASAGGELMRDPFSGVARQAPTAAPAPRRNRSRRTATALTCSAVMLGGERPVALISGRAYQPDQVVRGHTITAITADGVTLRRPDGGELVLAVGPARGDSLSFHVVTTLPAPDSAGETRLAPDTDERNDR